MTITIRFWRRLANFEPDYAKRIAKKFFWISAKECMAAIDDYKNYYNLAEYPHRRSSMLKIKAADIQRGDACV